MVAFALFYALYIILFHALFGWPASLWYALSLPVASLVAHYYLREMRRLVASLRAAAVLLRAPRAARRLIAERATLIALIEAERQDLALAPVDASGLSTQ
jgi:hypothetical protein